MEISPLVYVTGLEERFSARTSDLMALLTSYEPPQPRPPSTGVPEDPFGPLSIYAPAAYSPKPS